MDRRLLRWRPTPGVAPLPASVPPGLVIIVIIDLTIIRGPDCSLGPVPDTQNSSLGLVPVSIIDVWDWSQGYIFEVWDQIISNGIWSQASKMSLRD